MFERISRRGKIILVALLVLAAAGFAVTRSRRFVRGYFRFEQRWSERYPAVQKLTPVLCGIGILHPVRLTVEPGVSFLLDPRDLLALNILRSGQWQPEIWDSLATRLAEGRVFLDVGAHIGYFSMKAAVKVGKTGQVVAFEPNPETLKLLRDNVTANHAGNVTVEPIACTDREQTLTLYAAPATNTGASSLSRSNADVSAGEAPRPYSVRGRPIDDVVRELNLTRVDAIKVDVEGAELYVLRGALNTLKRFHPKLVVEVVPAQLANMQTTPDDLISLLKGVGYNRSRLLKEGEHDWEWTLQDAASMASTVRMADASVSDQLIAGFHGIEGNAWRWTERSFQVALRRPAGDNRGAWLTLKFTIPEVSLNKLKSMTLSVKIGDFALTSETFNTAGDHEYRQQAPASALGKDIVNVDFLLDKFLGREIYGRELGIVVTSVGLESK